MYGGAQEMTADGSSFRHSKHVPLEVLGLSLFDNIASLFWA